MTEDDKKASYEDGYNAELGYNANAFAHSPPHLALLGRVVKLIAAPVGLAREAIHARGNKDATTAQDAPGHASEDLSGDTYVAVSDSHATELINSGQAAAADGHSPTHELVPEGEDGADYDDADWALDEAAEAIEPSSKEAFEGEPGSSTHAAAPTPSSSSTERLPYPVIVPQRRPGTKTRGFIRAYAPVLDARGLDETTFLTFLKDLHGAAQASPLLDVVVIATGLASFSPDPFVGLPLQALQIVLAAAQELQERWRLNTFLNAANKDLFVPRGLVALVVAYKKGKVGEDEVVVETRDLAADALAKYGGEMLREGCGEEQDVVDEVKEKAQRLRVASAKTREAEMPIVCAPLTFPVLDAARRSTGEDTTLLQSVTAKSKATAEFVNDYFDRRGRAAYAAQNADSSLAAQTPKPEFSSRYANPNDITNKHFFALITGGRWKAQPLGAKRRWEKAQRKAEKQRQEGKENEKGQKGRKRLLQEDVLYLMIVDLPSPEEMAAAKARLEEKKAR